jgi:hypothetical protein
MSIFKTKLILTEQEDSILGLVKNMVSKEECLIEVDPETMDYLLSMDKLQYYLLIDSEGVQISNHDFFISRRLRGNVVNLIKDVVKTETSKRRQTRINSIFSNELELLTKINKAIDNGSRE